MISCKAKNCDSLQNNDPNVTFHKFPLFDPQLLKSWIENIAPPEFQPTPEDHVCSLHFTDEQFMNAEPGRLNRNAIPTIVDVHPNVNSTHGRKTLKRPAGQKKRKITKRKADDSSDNDSTSSLLSSTSDDDSEDSGTEKKIQPETKKSNALPTRYIGDFKEEVYSPEKTKKMWDTASKDITEQRNKLQSITQKNKRLAGQVTRLKNIIKHLKSVHK